MSCRSTPAGSVATTVARLTADRLSDPAILSLFHELRRNYRPELFPQPNPSDSYRRALAHTEAAIERLHSLGAITEARHASLMRRLTEARQQEAPDAATIYALHHIRAEAASRVSRLQVFISNISRRTGMTDGETWEAFQQAEAEAPRARGRHTTRLDDTTRRQHISHDPGVQHAMRSLTSLAEEVEIGVARQRPQRVELQPLPPSVNNDGVAVTSAGYDARVGHLVITTEGVVSNRDGYGEVQQHAYRRVPSDVWTEIRTSSNPSEAWSRLVRGNPNYQYASEHEAALASAAPRCPECGQYADAQHACPVPTPQVELATWTSQQRWSTARAIPTGVEGNDVGIEDSMSLPAIREFRTRVSEGAVRVRDVSGLFAPITHNGEVVREGGSVRGNITVSRAEDGTLTVSTGALRCTCPEFQRNSDCRHLHDAANIVRNRIDPPARSRARITDAERDAVLREAQQRAETAAAHDWTRNDETRAEAAATWRRDSDVLYSENVHAFKADYDAALQSRAAKNGDVAIPYMTENALDGMATRQSGQGFGTEIEFDFPRSMSRGERARAKREIAQELYDAGITRTSAQEWYGFSRRFGFVDSHTQEDGTGTWSFEHDGSVGGGELVTCVMYDEPETWRRLDTALDIIKRHGGVPSKKAGAHVHVGSGAYSGDVASYTELGRMMTQHEDVYFRLASDPNRGTHRANSYARPLRAVPDEGFADVAQVRSWQGFRYAAVNFTHVRGGQNDHPEFRLFDSSLDAGTLQSQIKLAVATVNAAQRNAGGGGTRRGKEPWGSHKERYDARGTRRRLSDDEFEADTATTRSLIDTLFRRREDKAQMAALFAHTKWSKSRRST